MYKDVWNDLRFFPSVLLLYAGGLAAVSAENYDMLAALVNRPKYHDHEGEKSLFLTLSLRKVFGEALEQALTEYKHFAGSSVYLSNLLRPLFNEAIPQKYRFEAVFDRFTVDGWPSFASTLSTALPHRSLHRRSRFITSYNHGYTK